MYKELGILRRLYKSFPKEHGAWVTQFACCLLGGIIAGHFGVPSLILFLTAVFAYMARYSLLMCFRYEMEDARRLSMLPFALIYSVLTMSGGVVLLLVYQLWWLFPIAVLVAMILGLALVFKQSRVGSSLVGGLCNMTAASFLAPAAEYAASGIMSKQTVLVWVICWCFFCGSVFRINYMVRKYKENGVGFWERLRMAFPSLSYHIVTLILVASVACGLEAYSWSVLVCLLPVTLYAFKIIVGLRPESLSFRRIGMTEAAHALVFIALAYLTL